MEIWQAVTGEEGRYEISNYGLCRSVDHNVNHRSGKRISRGRILKFRNHTQGYYQCQLGRDKAGLIHRLVAIAFIPNPENKPFVNHKDGNKRNNHVDNLEWSTRQENEDHAFATGLKNSSGAKNAMARRIKHKATGKTFETIKDAAQEFGLNYGSLRTRLSEFKATYAFEYI